MVEGCSKLGCMQFSNFAGINNKISKKSLVAQFIKNEEDEEVINELEQELKHRKEILAKKRDN